MTGGRTPYVSSTGVRVAAARAAVVLRVAAARVELSAAEVREMMGSVAPHTRLSIVKVLEMMAAITITPDTEMEFRMWNLARMEMWVAVSVG